MNSDPHNYFLNFPVTHLTEAASPTKLCIDFYSGDTVDIEMKDIDRRRIPSRDLSNSHFLLDFFCVSDCIASYDTFDYRSTATIPSLDHSVLM